MNEDFRVDKQAYFDYLKGRKWPGETRMSAQTYHWNMYNIKFSLEEFKAWLTENGHAFTVELIELNEDVKKYHKPAHTIFIQEKP